MFKEGDKVYCVSINSPKHWNYEVRKIYTVKLWVNNAIQTYENNLWIREDRMVKVLTNNKLNRAIYPNHKIVDNYLIRE